MLKSRIINLIALSLLFYSCVTAEKELREQRRQFGNYVTVYVNDLSLHIPSDMYIITKDYYTKKAEKIFRRYDGNRGSYTPSIIETQEWFNSINCLLYASKPSYAEIQVFSFVCDKNYVFESELIDIDYVIEINDWISQKREEKVIDLLKPRDRLKIQNFGVINIGNNSFLQFTKTYGGHIVDEKYFCMIKDENIMVISFIHYGENIPNENLERLILESIVFINIKD
jgi:hypothetical protein